MKKNQPFKVSLFLLIFSHLTVTLLFGQIPISISSKPNSQNNSRIIDRIEILLAKAKMHLDGPSGYVASRDSATSIIVEAINLSKAIDAKLLENRALLLLGRAQFKIQETSAATATFEGLIKYYEKIGNKKLVAETWYKYAVAMLLPNYYHFDLTFNAQPINKKYNSQILNNLMTALSISKNLGDKRLQSMCLLQLGYIHQREKAQDKIRQDLQQLFTLSTSPGTVEPYKIYALEMYEALYRDKVDEAIHAGIEALKNIETLHKEQDLNVIYKQLGLVYSVMGNHQKTLEVYKTYLYLCEKYHKDLDPSFYRFYVSELLHVKKNEEALTFVKTINPNSRKYYKTHKASVYEAIALAYAGNGRFDEAEKNYTTALEYLGDQRKGVELRVHQTLGMFYAKAGQYPKAYSYFQKVVDSGGKEVTSPTIRDAYLNLFRLDTLMHKDSTAWRNLNAYQQYKDRILDSEAKNHIEKFQILYETEKKDKNIKLLTSKIKIQAFEDLNRQKSLQLLKSRLKAQEYLAKIKEKNILLLNNRVRIQHYASSAASKNLQLLHSKLNLNESEIRRSKLIRNVTIAGVILLSVILGLLYNQYRLNKRSTRVINLKNAKLYDLLTQKELLVKEVHHRVKNNLQMVMSLLESQSAYLDKEALEAIQTSQHRVQAISMIHQKLYLTDSITRIDMSFYLRDLVSYLRDSLTTVRGIIFKMEFDKIALDVSQAVPLGLVVNETVTNAIKYAFPEGSIGNIEVKFKHGLANDYHLEISDDGNGFPQGFDIHKSKSLGMKLIKGLSNTLAAQYTITNLSGIHLKLVFREKFTDMETMHKTERTRI